MRRDKDPQKGEQGELLYDYDENIGFAYPDHKNLGHDIQGDLPATSINWFSCVAYCRWFSEKTGLVGASPRTRMGKSGSWYDGRFFPGAILWTLLVLYEAKS